jgi:hypothetical protein
MSQPLIKKSYIKIQLIGWSTGLFIPFYGLVLTGPLEELGQKVGGAFILYSLLIASILYLAVYMPQYGKILAFDGIYRKWKKMKKTQNGVALEGKIYRDMYRFKEFEHYRKKQIQNGEVSYGFTIEQTVR